MRKAKPKKRTILPDPRYNDPLVTQFVNNLMLQGKKNLSFKIFYEAMDIIEGRMKQEKNEKNEEMTPLDIWKKALENITPQVEVKSRRVGGATFQVPMEVRPGRKVSLSMKNLILFARKRSGKSMSEKLDAEIQAAVKGEGGAYKRKEDMHRMAEANKAFAHFKW